MEEIDEEKMKEQLEAEMSRYEEEGYFKRLFKMFAGLGKPRGSGEYKEALTELQRQVAPLTAILLPLIAVVVLFVVTAVGNSRREAIKVDIVQATEEDTKLEEVEPPPEIEQPQDVDVDVQVDAPSMNTEVSDPTPAPTAEPQSVKVANVDAMLNVKSPVIMKNIAGTARGAGMRGTYTKGGKGYGDAATEGAVYRALRWLKATQNSDGSWSTSPKYGLTEAMPASAGTGFAVLTFLAHGETPASKEFGSTIERALNYLIASVYEVKNKDGSPAKDPNGKTPYVKMRGSDGHEYAFLIGTYALCEAYAMTKNPDAKAAAEKTLRRIIDGQTSTGGWNYNMARVVQEGAPDDISFGGWAMQAIKAGKMAGIHIDGMNECIKKAVQCLKKRNYSERAGFVYRATTNHKGGSGGLAGVGCLAMQLLGFSKEPEVTNALRVMSEWSPCLEDKFPTKTGGNSPQYYCYYAAQCKYQAGMSANATPANKTLWQKWNQEMKALYPKAITICTDKATKQPLTIPDADGKPQQMGYWVNKDAHNKHYRVMSTCLAALQLMVYYRYLPTTQLKAAEVEADVDILTKDTTGEVGVSIDI